MSKFESISQEILSLIEDWETKLLSLSEDVLARRNNQNRTIKQIIGHMCDSATNNTHRIVHLQYCKGPLEYPNYATFGNNDRWIAIQRYEEENWNDLIQLWKYLNMHFAFIIRFIDETKLDNTWTSGINQEISLEDIVTDFPRHFELHMQEILDLIAIK